ncbi:MAG: HEAT repeat domain-containing protein [Gemmatimonadetes bacterium]|nr:HEAT repeat domain-containing protein [Gemmatimonadota bacterium]
MFAPTFALDGDVDPADSLFRVANDRLAKGDYKGAAELFRAVRQRYPKSARLGEAMYFEAFALYRGGDPQRARLALDEMKSRYPQQAARGDANTLRTRVCGELARQGDGSCAEEVTRASASAASGGEGGSSVRMASSGSGAARGGARSARSGECGNDDDEDDERIAALNALLQMDADRALPILTKVLARRDKCSERLRRKAVFLVSQKSGKETADILLATAKDDPDAEVREQAVFWLSQVRDPRAVDMLNGILTNTSAELSLREKALFALSQHSAPKAAELLRNVATDDAMPVDLREKAIFWIGQRHGDESAEYLRTLYRKLTNSELKEKVIFSLAQKRASANEAFLMGIVGDTKEPIELRKKAIFWAGQMGADLAQFNGLYAKLDDRDLKEQVIFAFSQRREAAATDRLIEIARSEKDRELRKKAIFWLGQSRDPRATAFLSELVDK